MTFQDNLLRLQTAGAAGKARERRQAQPGAGPRLAGDLFVHPTLGSFTCVESSNIEAMRFERSKNQEGLDVNEEVGHLEVLFHNGTCWRYGYLRRKDYDALRTAQPSIGRHFHKFIKARVGLGSLDAKQIFKP